MAEELAADAVGAALAQVHLAARDFAQHRADRLTPAANLETLRRCGAERLAAIHPELPAACALAQDVAARWPGHLPRSIIHSDLFPDNVLMLGERVTGFIDFYFACDGMMAYDLAVTHAAWSFDLAGGRLSAPIGAALLEGYETVRSIAPSAPRSRCWPRAPACASPRAAPRTGSSRPLARR